MPDAPFWFALTIVLLVVILLTDATSGGEP
jgi:hypothetical protein